MFSHLQRPVRDGAESHALESDDRVTDGIAHVPNLPCPPLVQRDRDQRLILARAQAGVDDAHDGRRRPAARDHDAAAQPIELALVGHAPQARMVLALDFVARVEQARREFPVVGEQEQTLRVVVEPSNGIDVLAHLGEQVEHGRPALGILPGRHVAARLVEQDVAVLRGDTHALAIHPDVVAGRVGPGPEFEDGDPVHGHAAIHDQRLGRAPRRDTRCGEDLLEPVAGRCCGHVAFLASCLPPEETGKEIHQLPNLPPVLL